MTIEPLVTARRNFKAMASFHNFLDPFWEPEGTSEPQPPPAAPPEGYQLEVPGKGIIFARSTAAKSLCFKVSPPNGSGDRSFTLDVTKGSCVFSTETADVKTPLPNQRFVKMPPASANLRATRPGAAVIPTVYWLSIDRSNAVIRYGKDLPNNALTNLEVQLDKETDKWIESLVDVSVIEDGEVSSQTSVP